MDELPVDEPRPLDRRGRLAAWVRAGWRGAVCLGLVVLPIVAAVLGYYRGIGTPDWDWQLHGDQVFYGYQITRAAETGGRWWQMADDHRLGWPYPSTAAKLSALFEGVDLLLVSTLSARLLDPAHNYYFLTLLIFAINGWIAGGIVYRLTGSAFWAAAAILLITCNEPVSFRLTGHLHLYKFGWLLLAVWAFSRYLDSPSPRRGIVLGLAVALVLQGSFYFGFFLVLTLSTWWLGWLIAGKFDRRHVAATVAAAVAFVLPAALLTFPIWTITPAYPLADQSAQHPWKHTWYFSSEPWQWLVSRGSASADQYMNEIGAKGACHYYEGGGFPGYTVLAGIAVYAIGRLRGRRFCERQGGQLFLDVVMGQIALLVGLSLTGGLSFFLFRIVPSIRCYGRAGMMGLVGLGCVAAPVCLHALTRGCRFRVTRAAIMLAVAALVAYDLTSLQGVLMKYPRTAGTTPAWVDWLAKQPQDVKLAAFGPLPPEYWYGNLEYAIRHGHTCLNGGDLDLLNGDLNLLGAYYQRMNPEGFRFVASLGYETLAIHRSYLDENPWIRSLAWLDRQTEAGEWLIFRTNSRFQRIRIPAVSRDELLARQGQGQGAAAVPAEVPPQSWITGQLDLDRTVVLEEAARVYLAWADASGRLVSTPRLGLYQHLFGPDLPAYTIKTPMKGGTYRLVFLDEHRRPLGSKPFVVSPELLTSRQIFRNRPPDFPVSPLTVRSAECRGDRVRITLENKTDCYIQAHTLREKTLGTASIHPGMSFPSRGSLMLEVNTMEDERNTLQVLRVLPHDLPPHSRLVMDLPIDWRTEPGSAAKLFIVPKFLGVEQRFTAEHLGEVALSLDAGPERTATKPAASPVR